MVREQDYRDIIADTATSQRLAAELIGVTKILAALNIEAYGVDSSAVVEVTRWSGALSFRNTLQRERTGTEMWMLFAFLALAVGVAETLLGNRFSRSK